VSIVEPFANWVRDIAPRLKPVVIAVGNPYVIGQFPNIEAYMVTYSVGDAPERAAARGLLGAPITGRSPVGLPGIFSRSQTPATDGGR
jgi:hypothetical protein